MKALTAALALAGTLVAAQAHADNYGFIFTENNTSYFFNLDTSTATGANARANTVFTGVNIISNNMLIGQDTISFSGIANQTTDPAGGRTLAATGAYAFNFNPTNAATGFGTAITFTPSTTVGVDSTRNDIAATLGVTGPAVTVTSAAPEPGAWALMLGGVAMLGAMLRIRKARRDEDAASDIATA